MLLNKKMVFISATFEEVKDSIKKLKFVKIENKIFKIYKSKNENWLIIISGIGKTNAAFCTQWIIDNIHPTKIINIGFCGSLSNNFKIGDVIVPFEARYWDVDLVKFGYEVGQIPNNPPYFPLRNINIKDIIISKENILCLTGDSFIVKPIQKINKYINTDTIIDMELASIAQVCFNNQYIRFFSIKLISDYSLIDDNAIKSYRNNIEICSSKMTTIIEHLIKYN